ncbi:MAG: hypothetical protein A3G08_02145 [Candidatus Magasanikbacteria bacterium RIFCSPLOWO2_12_FULL_47_9b]|nr:MAG: hypothetical protein A3I74_03350 [Candidatus Magasanikbacteria bacterium RIFCSPLOWO2_02_FULL_47_16]OGH80242.1 MAG: hypothetical protein A3C10_03630 [Candidatus Magasanikbacteria bacterium RIFCSPHIGHO2_02_FULL_48_18]OGH82140.1 MAG: hypothetical protein A3G08_02145 [Candidatus Magasanikbacteria bacterium RIFCSPLOWO2_12_FULL_47_9b]
MSLKPRIESILFVASKPLGVNDIARALSADPLSVEKVIQDLCVMHNTPESGIHILFQDGTVQMATNPGVYETTELFLKDEIAGELTKAQLESLTVIAYKGPITRPELEQIRGVNCAVIIRNLMIRGLVEEKERDSELLPVYHISMEALRQLAVTNTSELPNFDVLSAHDSIPPKEE